MNALDYLYTKFNNNLLLMDIFINNLKEQNITFLHPDIITDDYFVLYNPLNYYTLKPPYRLLVQSQEQPLIYYSVFDELFNNHKNNDNFIDKIIQSNNTNIYNMLDNDSLNISDITETFPLFDVNYINKTSLLELSIIKNTLWLQDFLLKHGANPNINNPLLVALKLNYMDSFNLLLKYGAHINLIHYNDLIYHKIKYNIIDVTPDMLTPDMYNVNYTWNKIPSLYYAIKHNNINIVEYLLSNGANPNIFIKGETPLTLAADYKFYVIIQLLLLYGSDPSIVNNNKETPLLILLYINIKKYNSNIKNIYKQTIQMLINTGKAKLDYTSPNTHESALELLNEKNNYLI